MVIIGQKLKELIIREGLVDNREKFDDFSISLSLHNEIIVIKDNSSVVLIYGEKIPNQLIARKEISNQGLIIHPKQAVLGCSFEFISMPKNYFGLIQTKGSLARLFVTVTCCDGQIEPGFRGRATLEIVNMGNNIVRIDPFKDIAQLFVFSATNIDNIHYKGRYQNAEGPTIQTPK